jgi:hypothetical protein
MKNQQHIEKKIEEALGSMDGIERAEVKPFFFTRLEAKLESETQPSFGRFSFLVNMKFNLAMLTVVFMFNVASAILISQESSTSVTDQSNMEMFTEEYSSVTYSYEDLNNY